MRIFAGFLHFCQFRWFLIKLSLFKMIDDPDETELDVFEEKDPDLEPLSPS